ncbi:MAG TPA: hypothetical protein VLM75_13510 [Spirochaetota bacterium]|nr:hypothetical protein [Spirochaetota bacterium]
MEIPKEIIEKLADEVIKELEENARKAGKDITFEDMEEAMLLCRQRIGNCMMQAATDKVVSGTKEQKKTAHNAAAGPKKKDTKRKR